MMTIFLIAFGIAAFLFVAFALYLLMFDVGNYRG